MTSNDPVQYSERRPLSISEIQCIAHGGRIKAQLIFPRSSFHHGLPVIQRLRAFLGSREGKALLGLLLLALALRLAGALNTRVISHDGARFTVMARALQDGDWESALRVEPMMPLLYPLTIAKVSAATGDLRAAGVAISILLGSLAILPLWALARSAWGPGPALGAALVMAVQPNWALLGADVWTEPAFLCLFFGSCAATWFANERPAMWRFGLAGLLGGLAINVRPEGAYAAAALLGWTAVSMWVHRREPEGRRIRPAGALFGLALIAVLILPYASWIHDRFGFWSFTPNQFAAKLLGGKIVESSFTEGYNLGEGAFELGRDQASAGKWGGLLLNVAKTYHKGTAYVFIPLLIWGLAMLARRRPVRREAWFLILIALGYALPTWMGLLKGLPFGERYALPSFLALAPIMALPVVWTWSRGTWGRIAVALLVAGCAVRIASPHEEKRRSLAEAGTWIRERYGPRKWIVSMDRRVEHYADGYSQRVTGSYEETRRRAESLGAVAVVIYANYADRLEAGFEEKLSRTWPKVHTVTGAEPKHEVRIYEVKR